MSASRRPGYAPVVFDDHIWSQDLARTSVHGRAVVTSTRRAYDRRGCPVTSLRRCEEEGADGTRLPGCVKVYLPPPAGRFGMVFRIARDETGTKLTMLAFGMRHPPRHANAPSVYRLADRRLHAR
jgi:hypothetical protein